MRYLLLALCCAFPALAQTVDPLPGLYDPSHAVALDPKAMPFYIQADDSVVNDMPSSCSTHARNWSHPLSSNMCPDDYAAWKKGREHDRWYRDRWFWTGTGIIGASVAADAWTTSAALGRGAVEENPILGPRPSNAKIAAWSAGGFAAYVGLHYVSYKLSHNDPSKAWRTFGRWSIPAIVAGIHVPLAVHNSHTCEKGCP